MSLRVLLLLTIAINFLHGSSLYTLSSPENSPQKTSSIAQFHKGYLRSNLETRVDIDIETTGVRRYNQQTENGEVIKPDRIVEIYLRKFQNNKLIDTFYSLFNPGPEKLKTYAVRVHKLTPEQLKRAPSFADKADEIKEFISGFTLVGHNCAFDAGFLYDEFLRAGQDIHINYKCTRWMLHRDYRRARLQQLIISPSPKKTKRRFPLSYTKSIPVKRRLDIGDDKHQAKKKKRKAAPISFSLDACLERNDIKLDMNAFNQECDTANVPSTRRGRHGAVLDTVYVSQLFSEKLLNFRGLAQRL